MLCAGDILVSCFRMKNCKRMIYLLALLLVAVALFARALFTQRDLQIFFSSDKHYTHDSIQRSYIISLPKGNAKKLVIGLHGFGDTPKRFAYYTALHNSVDDNTIVIYPQAFKPTDKTVKPGWNAEFCCGSGWVNKVDDAGFIDGLVKDVAGQHNINNKNIYLVGFSNGAFMTQKVAVEYPEHIGGIAVVSGSIGTTKSSLIPRTPMSALFMHGKKDTIIPFEGGLGAKDPDFRWRSFDEMTTVWKNVNGDAVRTKVVVHADDGHKWHDWRLLNLWHKETEGSKEVVRFFDSLDER